jgi:methionyl-tRNA synthetase
MDILKVNGQVISPEMMTTFMIVLIIILIWSAVWKAMALWKSARNKQVAWFVVLCIFNTIGLLEILYLAFWQKNKNTAIAVDVKKPVKVEKKPVKKK